MPSRSLAIQSGPFGLHSEPPELQLKPDAQHSKPDGLNAEPIRLCSRPFGQHLDMIGTLSKLLEKPLGKLSKIETLAPEGSRSLISGLAGRHATFSGWAVLGNRSADQSAVLLRQGPILYSA